MKLDQITPLVLTYNESPNISRCLEPLAWAQRVVVLDSGSTDDTAALVQAHTNTALMVRPFDNHTAQWNHGVDAVTTPWVLSLDADYVLTAAFVAELEALPQEADVVAYYAPFLYCVGGRPLRACLYPPRAVLFRKEHCRYVADGHTQLLDVPGRSGSLKAPIHHDDRKPLTRWFWAQDRYALLEAEKLATADPASLRIQDKLRLKVIYAPLVTLVYTLVVRGVILDGWRGWFYAFQRMTAEVMLSLRLLERKFTHE